LQFFSFCDQCCGSGSGSVCFWASWIRIRYEVQGTDPSLILKANNSKQNLNSYYFFYFLSLKNAVNVASKKVIRKKYFLAVILKVADENTVPVSESAPKRNGTAILSVTNLHSSCVLPPPPPDCRHPSLLPPPPPHPPHLPPRSPRSPPSGCSSPPAAALKGTVSQAVLRIPDPGTGDFLTSGSEMGKKIKIRIRDEHPGSYFRELRVEDRGKNSLIWIRVRDLDSFF
jgi:hypothetical protein